MLTEVLVALFPTSVSMCVRKGARMCIRDGKSVCDKEGRREGGSARERARERGKVCSRHVIACVCKKERNCVCECVCVRERGRESKKMCA